MSRRVVQFETVFPTGVFGEDELHSIVPCPKCGHLTFDCKKFELFKLSHPEERGIFSEYYASLAKHISSRMCPPLVVNNLNEQGLPGELYIFSCAQKQRLSLEETDRCTHALAHIGTPPPPWKSDEEIIAPEHAVELFSCGSDEDIAAEPAVELSCPNSFAEDRSRTVYLLAVLNIALSNKNMQMVEMLLGCKWMEWGGNRGQLLWRAAKEGDKQVVSQVLEKMNGKPNEDDIKEALWTAAYEGHLPVLKQILPSVTTSMSTDEWELVVCAAMDGDNAACVEYLCQVYKGLSKPAGVKDLNAGFLSRSVKQGKQAVIEKLFSSGILTSKVVERILEEEVHRCRYSSDERWDSSAMTLILSKSKILYWSINVTSALRTAAEQGDQDFVSEALSFPAVTEATIINAFYKASYKGHEEVMLTILRTSHRLMKWTILAEKAQEILLDAKQKNFAELVLYMVRHSEKRAWGIEVKYIEDALKMAVNKKRMDLIKDILKFCKDKHSDLSAECVQKTWWWASSKDCVEEMPDRLIHKTLEHVAVSGDVEIMKSLLKGCQEKRWEVRLSSIQEALKLAVRNDVTQEKYREVILLMLSGWHDNLWKIQYLFDEEAECIDCVLEAVAGKGDTEIIKVLLAQWDPSRDALRIGLGVAAMGGHQETVSLLLQDSRLKKEDVKHILDSPPERGEDGAVRLMLKKYLEEPAPNEVSCV